MMENAKALIIIQPMSPPLRKLYEVLLSISIEENIEITLIENLHEAAQLFSMGGQFLTLVSDPKNCAMFLQENRASNLARHSKTLLFTPKPLPAKFLDKFIKLGLTENLLDSAQPKTLLFKVKLLLKSLKPNTLVEEKAEKQDQVIKSMLDLNVNSTGEKPLIHTEEVTSMNTTTSSDPKKKKIEIELEGGLDYLTNLNKKKSHKEESIDTNWSSRKSNSTNIALEGEEEDKTGNDKYDKSNEELDGYMRNKQVKNINIEFSEDSASKENKNKQSEISDENDKHSKEKKQLIELELQSTKEKAKNKSVETEESERSASSIKSLAGIEIELEKTAKRADNGVTNETDEAPLKTKKSSFELELESQAKTRNKDIELDESNSNNNSKKQKSAIDIELANNLKKTKGNSDANETEEPSAQRKVNSELEITPSDRKTKSELLLEQNAEEREKNKHNSIQLEDSTDSEGDEGENNSTSQESVRKKKETELELEHSKKQKEESNTEKLSEESDYKRKLNLIDSEATNTEHDKSDQADVESEGDKKRKTQLQNLELTTSDKEKSENEKNESEQKNAKDKKTTELDLNDSADKNSKTKQADIQDKEGNLKSRNRPQIELSLESSRNKNDHSSSSIDTHMRSKESTRKEQDWSQKNNNKDITLKMVSKSSDDIDLKNSTRKDNGEITIDYRTLREEFNDLAKSNYKSSSSSVSREKEDEFQDEESHHKVIILQANGFDFAVNIINQYYNPDIKSVNIIKSVAYKLFNEEKALSVFYSYSHKTNEHKELFSSFTEFPTTSLEFWNQLKLDKDNFESLFSYSMSTWICREIKENNSFWKDTELPSWATQELTNKPVEFIYPFFDGLDRMGLGYLYFPDGIQPENEKKIIVLLELIRGIFLETIQRQENITEEVTIETEPTKVSNVINLIGGFFNRKKTG